MCEAVNAARESNVKEHNEKYADQYKWTLENNDEKLNSISTRTYDMSGVRDSQGKKYDSLYQYFNEDGTYNVEGWMSYNREKINGGYTCSAENK